MRCKPFRCHNKNDAGSAHATKEHIETVLGRAEIHNQRQEKINQEVLGQLRTLSRKQNEMSQKQDEMLGLLRTIAAQMKR